MSLREKVASADFSSAWFTGEGNLQLVEDVGGCGGLLTARGGGGGGPPPAACGFRDGWLLTLLLTKSSGLLELLLPGWPCGQAVGGAAAAILCAMRGWAELAAAGWAAVVVTKLSAKAPVGSDTASV